MTEEEYEKLCDNIDDYVFKKFLYDDYFWEYVPNEDYIPLYDLVIEHGMDIDVAIDLVRL